MKTTEKIIDKIKREGAITAKQVAECFAITTMGARQHLQTLEDEGVIAFHDVKVKIGRPTRHWTLTKAGHEQFSNRHSDLTIQMFDAVESIFGSEGLSQVVQRRESNTLANYQSQISHSMTLESKVRTLTEIRTSEGYMAEYQPTENGFLLIENHCPICQAATRCESLCQSELNIFQTLLGEHIEVSRSEHIVQGARRCCYQITPE